MSGLLGQASGAWTESSAALRIMNVGIRNSIGVLTDDAFTQANPVSDALAVTNTAQVDATLTGVLSGSVAFTRPDAGSNFIGGPDAAGALIAAVDGTAGVVPLGVFINSANGNAFENTPGTASGKGPYVSAQGTYGNTLYEDKTLSDEVYAAGNAGTALLAYAPGMRLYASKNGFLTHGEMTAQGTAMTVEEAQFYEGDYADSTVIGIVKVVPDAATPDLVYDQRI